MKPRYIILAGIIGFITLLYWAFFLAYIMFLLGRYSAQYNLTHQPKSKQITTPQLGRIGIKDNE